MATIQQSTIEILHGGLGLSDDWEFRTDYSGRGMYGSECIGLVTSVSAWEIVSSLADLIADFENDAPSIAGELREFLAVPHEDSMGYSTVYYWPGLTLETEEEE